MACSKATLVVGIEPTATATAVPTPVAQSYVNDEYGFTFSYPETWTLTEEPHRIALNHDTLSLTIAYGWTSNPGFSPMGGRTGMPAGDLLYSDKIMFLGQTVPVHALAYERKDKMLLYGDSGLVKAGNLAFSIWLEDLDAANDEALDIPGSIKDGANAILESFAHIEATGSPPDPAPTPAPIVEKDLITYVNDAYQLAFIYPSTWELEEIPSREEASRGPSANAVHLTRDTLRLVIQFKHPQEETLFWPGGRPAGDIVDGDTVTVMGQDVVKEMLVYESKVKSMFLSAAFEDLELYVQLDGGVDAEVAYEDLEISESVQTEMDAILGSLTRTGDPTLSSADTLSYTNDAYGFSFQHPADWTVEEVPGKEVEDGVRLADAVVLSHGTFRIVVQYQRKSESAQIAWGGDLVPGGMGYAEAVLGKPVTLLGEDTHLNVWSDDDGTKAIEVNTTGETQDLMLSITLADGSARLIQDAEAKALPESSLAALDQVLATFTTGE
jgi:hypothetical protein